MSDGPQTLLPTPGAGTTPGGRVLWFTGLPGCGKSSIARALGEALEERAVPVTHLAMDERRATYFPEPTYSDDERDAAYRLLAEEARDLAAQGRTVLVDGVAPKRAHRDYGRSLVEHFAEVFVSCPLEIAMEREAARPEGRVMADLYRKALRRKETGEQFAGLGQVPGVDVPYEENPEAEITLPSDLLAVADSRDMLLAFLSVFAN